MQQAERDPRVAQREALEQGLDVTVLGLLAAQEFLARRHVVEQFADLDAGPLRQRVGQRTGIAARLELPRVLGALPPRGERQARDRRDARQRLAAKAERTDLLEILEARNLAGRMARQRERQFVALDAAAVVGDADQAGAAGLDLDRDRAGAGVEAVLDEFLDHRGGPLDDFASGNLVDQVRRQRVDARQDAQATSRASSFSWSRANRRIPSASFSVAIASSLNCQRKLFSSRLTRAGTSAL